MEYTYNILDKVYSWMLSKQKNVEVRILKEKSEKIQIGDIITFNNQENEGKYIKAKVINKKIYNNIDELLNNYDVNRIMPNHTQNEVKQLLNNIYGNELTNNKIVAFEFDYISCNKEKNKEKV